MINLKEEEIRKMLIEKNEEFRKLYELHQKCEEKLKILQSKPYLTEEEKMEEKKLKKEKLGLKDKMQVFVNKFKMGMEKNANS
jgi:uncharacterized protein YdcH (DUF465 family)